MSSASPPRSAPRRRCGDRARARSRPGRARGRGRAPRRRRPRRSAGRRARASTRRRRSTARCPRRSPRHRGRGRGRARGAAARRGRPARRSPRAACARTPRAARRAGRRPRRRSRAAASRRRALTASATASGVARSWRPQMSAVGAAICASSAAAMARKRELAPSSRRAPRRRGRCAPAPGSPRRTPPTVRRSRSGGATRSCAQRCHSASCVASSGSSANACSAIRNAGAGENGASPRASTSTSRPTRPGSVAANRAAIAPPSACPASAGGAAHVASTSSREPAQDERRVELGARGQGRALAREVRRDHPVVPGERGQDAPPVDGSPARPVQQHERRAAPAFQHGGLDPGERHPPAAHRDVGEQAALGLCEPHRIELDGHRSLLASGPVSVRRQRGRRIGEITHSRARARVGSPVRPAALVRARRRRRARGDAELGEDVADVAVDGPVAEHQRRRDRPVRVARRHAPQHLSSRAVSPSGSRPSAVSARIGRARRPGGRTPRARRRAPAAPPPRRRARGTRRPEQLPRRARPRTGPRARCQRRCASRRSASAAAASPPPARASRGRGPRARRAARAGSGAAIASSSAQAARAAASSPAASAISTAAGSRPRAALRIARPGQRALDRGGGGLGPPLRQAQQGEPGLRLAARVARAQVRGLGAGVVAAQPCDLAFAVRRLGRGARPGRLGGAARGPLRLGERLVPGAVQLEQLGPVHQAPPGEGDHVRLRVAPARERGRPLLCAPELVIDVTAVDRAAVDEPGRRSATARRRRPRPSPRRRSAARPRRARAPTRAWPCSCSASASRSASPNRSAITIASAAAASAPRRSPATCRSMTCGSRR